MLTRASAPRPAPPRPGAPSLVQNLIFRFLQSRQKIQVWLFEHNDLRIEGRIIVSLFFCVCLCVVFYAAPHGHTWARCGWVEEDRLGAHRHEWAEGRVRRHAVV